MHPSGSWNTSQFVFPTYQIASNAIQIDGQMSNNLMNQYCNINPVIISSQYFPTSYFAPSIVFDQSQNQQQFQQNQQSNMQQQQVWVSNGIHFSQMPQVSSSSFIIQRSQNEDKLEFAQEESQNMPLRIKHSETISTVTLEPKTDIIDQVKFENIECSLSDKTKVVMLNEQNNYQIQQNNIKICSQNAFPIVKENKSQKQQKSLQSQKPFNVLTQRNTEVGNLINLSSSNLNCINSYSLLNQKQCNTKPLRFNIECKNQLKITKTDQNENGIEIENFIDGNMTSIKNSTANSNNRRISPQKSIPQLSQIKQEIIQDTVSNACEQIQTEQTLINNEHQPFKDLQSNIGENIEDVIKYMQSTVFFKNSELIFQNQYGKQFKLKQSYCKNDDIVFAKIKEYRKNKSHQSNENDNIQNPSKINSKFHNLNKLFMYKLLATFSEKNLQQLDVPIYLHSILLKLIMNLKQSTKEMKNYNKKTEFFSHDHYNLLFLHLNEKTLNYLIHSSFSIYLHKLCFNFDLNQLNQNNCPSFITQNQEKIQYINIIKRFCCQIVQNSNMLGVYKETANITGESNKIIPNQINSDSEYGCIGEEERSNKSISDRNSGQLQKYKKIKKNSKKLTEQEKSQRQNMRQAYTQRALKGILSLNQGVIIRRF